MQNKAGLIFNLKAYAALTRPKFQIPSVTSMIVGLLYSLYSGTTRVLDPKSMLAAVLVTGPFVAGGALVLNQVFDYRSDRTSSKKDLPIASGIVKESVGVLLSVILLFMGAIASLTISVQAGVATAIVIALSIMYSTPPIRLKARPYVDSLSNGLCYGVFPTLVGWTVTTPLSPSLIYVCTPLFLLFTGSHLLLAVPDIKDDKESGVTTTAVVLGQQTSVRIATILWLATTGLLTCYAIARLLPYQSLAVVPITTFAWIGLLRSDPTTMGRVLSRLKLLSLIMGLVFVLALLSALL